MPTWSNWEDYAVAGTFLYLEDKTVQAKYLNTAFEVGRGKSLAVARPPAPFPLLATLQINLLCD